jgi:hypothetical protein
MGGGTKGGGTISCWTVGPGFVERLRSAAVVKVGAGLGAASAWSPVESHAEARSPSETTVRRGRKRGNFRAELLG